MGQTPRARRLAQPSQEARAQANSRYDQEAIAYAEADEEEEEEEGAEEEGAEEEGADGDDANAAGRKHLDDDDDEVSYDEKTGISAEVRVQVTCGDLRNDRVPAGYKKQHLVYPDGRKVPCRSSNATPGRVRARAGRPASSW